MTSGHHCCTTVAIFINAFSTSVPPFSTQHYHMSNPNIMQPLIPPDAIHTHAQCHAPQGSGKPPGRGIEMGDGDHCNTYDALYGTYSGYGLVMWPLVTIAMHTIYCMEHIVGMVWWGDHCHWWPLSLVGGPPVVLQCGHPSRRHINILVHV